MLETEEMLNIRSLVLPFAVIMVGLVAAVHAVIVIDHNQVGLIEMLALAVVAVYYAFFFITRRSRLRQIRFGMLVAHLTGYLVVNLSYLIHAFVLILNNSPAIRGDDQFLIDRGWFGVTFAMATAWGIGLLTHALSSIASRGWEEHL